MPTRCGIVLAGGRGVRLGLSVPKALAELAGRTLLERAVTTLRVACGDVVVVTPPGFDVRPVAARRAFDVRGHAGPMAGLVAGLEACAGVPCAVLGVDFPLVSPEFVAALFSALDRGGADAVAPRPHGIPQPLVSVLAAVAAAKLRAALEAGVTSMRGGLEALEVEWLDDEALALMPGGADALLNVNTPADLEQARRALALAAEETG